MSGPRPDELGARVSDEQAHKQLKRVFRDVERWMQSAQQDRLTTPVEPGSSLAADDARSDPYNVSHRVTHVVGVAVDHLHALKVLIEDAHVLHNFAPYTLSRGAIEAAATALWILRPKVRSPRVLRCLSLAAQDSKDASAMATEAGVPVSRPSHEVLDELGALARQAGGPDAVLERIVVTNIVREIDAAKYTPIGALAAWRTTSGFTHGRQWSSLALLERESFPTADPEVVGLRLTNRLRDVLWPAWAAHDLVVAALRLYEPRARSPYSTWSRPRP